jgi:acyl-coenzyme A thioesterase PaaI-like protein
MSGKPIQDYYPDEIAVCFGCGRHNPDGLQIKTYWDGAEGICRFMPLPRHAAYPGVVYGGLIASLIDCHSVGTAVAAAYQQERREPGSKPLILFYTARLEVDYLSPAAVGIELELHARVTESGPRKAVVACSVFSGGAERARGKVTAVRAAASAGQ